jgi:hypothetical protein
MVSGQNDELNRVVARFSDGRILKGYTYDFTPFKDTFHISPRLDRKSKDLTEVWIETLKAIFFVKTFEGNPDYEEKKRFDEVKNPTLKGLKISVRFFDGEVIRGTSTGFSKKRKGFFMFPVDPRSNNERIYVVTNAVEEVILGSAAEQEDLPIGEHLAQAVEPPPVHIPAFAPQASVEKAPAIARCQLEIIGDKKDRVIELSGGEIVIGRGGSCGVRLSSKTVSRKHARIFFQRGAYHIEDLGSANGTYANGKKLEKSVLQDSDQIDIGDVRILFHLLSSSPKENA